MDEKSAPPPEQSNSLWQLRLAKIILSIVLGLALFGALAAGYSIYFMFFRNDPQIEAYNILNTLNLKDAIASIQEMIEDDGNLSSRIGSIEDNIRTDNRVHDRHLPYITIKLIRNELIAKKLLMKDKAPSTTISVDDIDRVLHNINKINASVGIYEAAITAEKMERRHYLSILQTLIGNKSVSDDYLKTIETVHKSIFDKHHVIDIVNDTHWPYLVLFSLLIIIVICIYYVVGSKGFGVIYNILHLLVGLIPFINISNGPDNKQK